jgi:hypothetical protein
MTREARKEKEKIKKKRSEIKNFPRDSLLARNK